MFLRAAGVLGSSFSALEFEGFMSLWGETPIALAIHCDLFGMVK